jgi:hypothetical protein
MARIIGKTMQSNFSDKKLIKYPSNDNNGYDPDKDGIENYVILSLSIQSNDILSKLLTDRLYLIKDEISEISQQIDERQKLKQSLNSEIDQRVCEVQNVIYGLELDMGNQIDKSRRRISLEQQIGELYKEKRQGELSHWQDTVMLKRELRKADKELRSASLDLWMMKFLS